MRKLTTVALSVCLIVLAGCGGGAYSGLAREDDIPELAAMRSRTAALANHTIVVQTCPEPRVGVAVHEISTGPRERTLVMIHGVLSDHRAWRFVTGQLAESYDLMLVDLPGCGESEKPDPATLEPMGYSPAAMAERVLAALEERLAARDHHSRLTIVAHSLGGAVALRMFCDSPLRERFGAVLSRVDSIVLLSPMDVSVNKPDPMFRKIAEVSAAEIAIGDALGILQERVAEAIRESVAAPERALREEADARLLCFRDPARRRAAQAMLKQAVPWKGERPDWETIEPVEQRYCDVGVPALILWGRRDETLPISMGYKLAAELPRAQLMALPGVMHSPHIESPGRTVELIRNFVEDGGGARAGR